uniref:PNPLA domain-containing protein n=1 Tax=viral metagenome TaxID=1070528 RepID=A0A6C0HVF5_9ZZZZ
MDESIEKTNKIKHLVISGGGPRGFIFYGILKELYNNGFWKLEDIETMYGTSIGSLLSVILCLNYDWDTIDDYFIKRPWQNIFKFNMYTIVDSFQKRGFFSINIFKESFIPLFKGKDISMDITLQEFYDLNGIELHIFATEINRYELIDFSYKTHGNYKVIDVVYYSCSLPIIFSPILQNDLCYCDGGLILNYPLEKCLKNGANKDEILGIKITIDDTNIFKINENSSIFDYIFYLITKILEKKLLINENIDVPWEITVKTSQNTIYSFYKILSSQEERIKLIEYGKECCKDILEKQIIPG